VDYNLLHQNVQYRYGGNGFHSDAVFLWRDYMSTLEGLKEIENWEELFDMTNEYLTFLVEQHRVTHDMIIKTTYDIIRNAGYSYTYDDIEREYYNGF
jgi:predicted membrane-bound dolichyl-phosphate-mannose-protein mannosyltransferase